MSLKVYFGKVSKSKGLVPSSNKKPHGCHKCAVAEICQGQSYWLPTNNNHPIGHAAPRWLPSIVTSQQSSFAHIHIGLMAGTDSFPEKCTVLCSESVSLFRVEGLRLMSRYGTMICAIFLLSAVVWVTMLSKLSSLQCSEMTSLHPDPHT